MAAWISAASYAPPRTVLDKLLLDAAAEACAEVRGRYAVQELVADGDRVTGVRGRSESGSVSVESARVVIGADWQYSGARGRFLRAGEHRRDHGTCRRGLMADFQSE